MNSKIIKSKRTNYGVVELIEFKDDFGKIINYSVAMVFYDNNMSSGVATKIEEKTFLNKKEAEVFFNGQK